MFQPEQLTVIPTKKQKLPDEQQQFHNYLLQQAFCNMQYDQVFRSFHNWQWQMPYFQQEPILQNPERVVRLTGNERFDGGFQPNVALAPRKPPRDREKEIEKDKNSRNNVAINSEIQIKQERPSSHDAIIQSPEATPTPPQNHPPPPLVSRHTNLKPISLPHKKQHHHHLQPRSPDELSSSSEITSSTSPIPKTKDSIKNSKSPLTVISTQQQQPQQLKQPPQPQQQGNKLVQLQHRTQQDIYAAAVVDVHQQQQPSRIRINKNLMNNSNIIRTPTPDMQNFKPTQHTSFPPPQPSPTSHMSSNHLQSIHQLTPAPTISPPAVPLSLISRRQRDGQEDGCIVNKKPHQNGVENGEADSQTPHHHVVMTPSPIPMTWETTLDAIIKDIPQVHQRDKIWQFINNILDENAQMKKNQRQQKEQIIDLQREIQYLRQQQLENQQHYPINGVINDSVTVTPVITPNKTPAPQPIIKNDIVVEKIKMPLKKSSRRSFEEARVQNEVVNLKTSAQLTVTATPIIQQNNTTKCEDRDSLKNEDTITTTTTTTKKPQTTNSTITPTISPTSSSSSPDSAVFDIKHGGSDDQKSTSSSSSSPSPAGGISIKTEE